MSKKILVVPDVHGDIFWKEPVNRYIDIVDKIIFLGDYLDPYPKEGEQHTPQNLFDNLMDIIDLKRKYLDKVVLLKGNHDQHYASEVFLEYSCASRCDKTNWGIYNAVFVRFENLFKIVHLENLLSLPYLFSHAGLTVYWIHKVNHELWKLADNMVSVTDSKIIEKFNQLEKTYEGHVALSTTGKYRSLLGEKTGSVLWADIEEHSISKAPKAYGLNKVFQVFGHTRLNEQYDKLEFDNLVMIDSKQCFIIDESREEKIMTIKDFERNI